MIPIIRFEIEGMRHTLQAMLSKHCITLDEDLQRAVECFCTKDNINSIINKMVTEELTRSIQSEIHSFFAYGRGKDAVKIAVEHGLRTTLEKRGAEGGEE